MQDEEAVVTAWDLDRTHTVKLAHSQNTLLMGMLHAACLCAQHLGQSKDVWKSGSLTTWAQGFGNHSSCSQKVWTLDMCSVLMWSNQVLAFWSFSEFSQCDRRGPSKLCPAGTWMTCLIRTLSSRTRMKGLHSIDSDRQIIVLEILKRIFCTFMFVVHGVPWLKQDFDKVSSSLLTRILWRH